MKQSNKKMLNTIGTFYLLYNFAKDPVGTIKDIFAGICLIAVFFGNFLIMSFIETCLPVYFTWSLTTNLFLLVIEAITLAAIQDCRKTQEWLPFHVWSVLVLAFFIVYLTWNMINPFAYPLLKTIITLAIIFGIIALIIHENNISKEL